MADSQRHPQYCSVHAAAGSGKTYLLVSRLIRLLLLGAEPGSILAITFTRKAAAEMQQRLLQRIHALSIGSDDWLAEQLVALDIEASAEQQQMARGLYEKLLHTSQPVRTTTFHAFCQDLLRRFPMEADIPPGFELTERIGELLDEAWSAFANELTLNDTSDTAQQMDVLLATLGMTTTRRLLDSFIHHRSEWWALQDSAQTSFSVLFDTLAAECVDDPATQLLSNKQALDQCEQFMSLLQQHATKTNQQFADQVAQVLNTQSDNQSRFNLLWNVFFTRANEARARKHNATLVKKLGSDGADRLIELHHAFCDRLITVRQQQHARDSLILSQAWMAAGARYLEHFQTIKRQKRVLDFNDLEWQSYRLLNKVDHTDWVQYKLDQRIDHLLVDEFQDTNPIQWNLLLPLLNEMAAGENLNRQRSVLFVGDSKQSIYRFRRAEPRLFDTATDWLQQKLDAQQQYLSKSYRSSPAIIEFVNRLFQDNDQYALPDFQEHDTQLQDLWGAVTLLPLIDSQKQSDLPYLRNPLLEPRQQNDAAHLDEARLVATTIQDLIDRRVVIRDHDQSRHITYSDIMLLFRNRTHAADYERALREAHIPYLGTERGTLLDSLEVRDMVNLLQWLITPFNNLALAGILRSPLFAISDADLQRFATRQHWYTHLLDIAPQFDATHPVARAARYLPGWIELAQRLPVHDLLDHIYSEANVLARYRANYPPHLQSRVSANLIRFIELALENDSGRYPSLTRFLAWLGMLRQQEQEAPDQPAGGAQQNRVQLLTIHEAKGLEAPVVFLMDANTTPAARRGPQVLVDWPAQASAPEQFLVSQGGAFPHPRINTIIELLDEKQQREEANLLYVAVTRARQFLYISGINKQSGWYQAICNQYALDANKIDQPVELQAAGQAPDCVAPFTSTQQPVSIDPQLRQPFRLKPLFREIAPSRVFSQHHSAPLIVEEDYRERGRVIHHILECMVRYSALTRTDYGTMSLQSLDEHKLADYWQEAQAVRETFPELFDNSITSHYVEVPITYSQDGTVVHGIIDRLIVDTDSIHLIDYKTHRVDENSDLPAFCQQFREQLTLYAQGIQRIFPDKAIRTSVLLTAIPRLLDLTTT